MYTVQRHHPHYGRRLKNVSLCCFAGAIVMLLVFATGMISGLLPGGAWLLAFVSLCFGTFFYFRCSMRRIRCPDCSSACEAHPDGANSELRVRCERCQVIWRLGLYRGGLAGE